MLGTLSFLCSLVVILAGCSDPRSGDDDGSGDDGGGAGTDGPVFDAAVSPALDAAPDVPVDLPGSIAGVEPEAHAHHPPMIDVWFQIFHTSAAAERPDEWVFEEQVGPDLANEGGVAQFSSLARTSDGQIWLFHSDTMIDGRQQIGFRRRSVTGDWSDKRAIGETSGSWTGPRPILGAADVTHVFYTDHAGDRLFWRTLHPSGELSSATRIDSSGTSDERLPHTNAVSYEQAGSEVIVVAFADDTGILRAITIRDGEVGPAAAVSPQPVLENPHIASNDGTVAHLSIDGTTVHALWVDRASGDVLHSARPNGGAWSSPPTVAWDSGGDGAWWVYGNVYERGNRRRLGFTYDIDAHPDDEGHIEYDEITLGN